MSRTDAGRAGRKQPGLPRGIDKRTDGMFRARVVYDGRQYSLGSFFTVGDAKAALAIARSEMARRTFVPPAERRRLLKSTRLRDDREALTLRQWAEVWLQGLQDADRSPGTIRAHRSLLDVHVLPVLGDARLVDITEDDIDELVAQVKALPSKRHEGARTNGVWPNVVRTLRAMLNAAVDAHAGGIETSPVRITVPKNVRVEKAEQGTDVATPAEVIAFTEGMPADLAISVPLAAWCALRLGELLGLQRHDFAHLDDPARATVSIRRQWNTKASPPRYTDPKSESARTVAVPAFLVPALVAHLDKFTAPGAKAPLLPGRHNPDVPVAQSTIDTAWRKARDEVRPGFRFHALRHTGLTEYGRAGATLRELMARGGHKSVDVALRYQHADAERDRALTKRLDAMIEGTHA